MVRILSYVRPFAQVDLAMYTWYAAINSSREPAPRHVSARHCRNQIDHKSLFYRTPCTCCKVVLLRHSSFGASLANLVAQETPMYIGCALRDDCIRVLRCIDAIHLVALAVFYLCYMPSRSTGDDVHVVTVTWILFPLAELNSILFLCEVGKKRTEFKRTS